ncbi:ATP-binding protein [Aestuariibacter sp. AA17]|uniref:histidine kinase n=1 Tax=Fluctibacter corallii TaxID=2984329 RepID=A0ABT3A7E1_9ALTE|nr:ATP-binding protein [Aestuariibacter sp. AA17]MCV2884569.1 ATP-binding protein [Aestuariibacter sp. AA17]
MITPAVPEDEQVRLATLEELDILDTENEERFDRLTRLAKFMSGAPIALVSLVDANRQWFKSKQGLDACETSRDISFCGHAILNDDVLYVPDVKNDERFHDNPLVTGAPDIRSYAGAPLRAHNGKRLGTLCIIDTKPTAYSNDLLVHLRDLADCVEAEFRQQSLLEVTRSLQDHQHRLNASMVSLEKHNVLLANLHRITSNTQTSFHEKIVELLEVGRKHFDMSMAIVSEIIDDHYYVRYATADIGAPEAGTHFDLGNTFCVHTMRANSALGFHHVAKSEIRTHPCYQLFKLESYIGYPIVVNGRRFGTVNFSSPVPKGRPFQSDDFAFVGLLGQWIGHNLESVANIDALTQAKEEAERHSRAKSDFLNVMNHELRTPLTVILGYLPLLKDAQNLPPAEMIAQLSNDMDTAGQQLMAMINDLLDISKVEADTILLAPKKIMLKSFFHDIVHSMRPLVAEKSLSFELDIDAEVAFADPIRLQQILYNLIANAIKFTEAGSISIGCQATSSDIVISISDTGCGIPSHQQHKVFSKFFQADSSTTRKSRGTGLGLAITQKLVELHGGTITLNSKEHQGTTVTFTLPQTGDHHG